MRGEMGAQNKTTAQSLEGMLGAVAGSCLEDWRALYPFTPVNL